MSDIGIQRYGDDDLDTRHPNSLDTFRKEILPSVLERLGPRKTLLDVGCGNGRFACELSQYVEKVTAIDAYRDPHDAYRRDNITYIRSSFGEFQTEDKYDTLLLFGTFYLLITLMPDLLVKCKDLLNDGGMVIVVDETKRDTSSIFGHGYYDLAGLASAARLTSEHKFVQDCGYLQITFLKK